MTLPLYDSRFLPALLLGVLFGLVLEGAGFGSARKLTAQFSLRDFAVLKVMLSAVVVAAFGLWALEALGVIRLGGVFVPTLYLWSIAAGGAAIGAGFAIGGYCPGTSAVGLASGRLDAALFMVGMVAGVGLFAAFFEPLKPFYLAAQGPKGQTLSELLGVPEIGVIAALAVGAVGIFVFGGVLERRFGGPIEPSGA